MLPQQIDDYLCRICSRGDDEDNLLVCDTDTCQACYHTYCLKPPLRSVPKCQWKCPDCIRSMCLEPPEPYGFPQSSKSYSLHEFGVMADEFKSKYFGKPCTVSASFLRNAIIFCIANFPWHCSYARRLLHRGARSVTERGGPDYPSHTTFSWMQF